MTQIAPKKFFDELDNHYEIKKALLRPRYIKPYMVLYTLFFTHKVQRVTGRMLREGLCMSDRVAAYQILDSLRILNLLVKIHVPARKEYFFMIKNPEWWHKYISMVKAVKNGSNRTDK